MHTTTGIKYENDVVLKIRTFNFRHLYTRAKFENKNSNLYLIEIRKSLRWLGVLYYLKFELKFNKMLKAI